MLRKRWKWGIIGLLALWLALPLTASAHPLGNFTVNRYSRIEIGADGIKLHYVLDMAEIPTFQEKDQIDLNHDGQISADEQQAYLGRKSSEIRSNLKLTLDGAPVELKIGQGDLNFPAGQGGLQIMRLTVDYESAHLSQVSELSYQDENFSDRLGWKEIVVRNGNGVALVKSSAPSTDQSNELRTYPEDMLASPLNLTSAQVSFRLDPSVKINNTSGSVNEAISSKTNDPFADLLKGGELTLSVILVSLLAAFGLGMVHALSPGHGKTIVAAYLVGTRGTARHAAFLGLTVTVTHTLGVFALGLLTLFASQFILPEKLYPWLGLASGLIVLLMGLSLLRSRLRFAITGAAAGNHSHEHHDHSHNHDHSNGHSHENHSHSHAAPAQHHDNNHEHEHHEQHSHNHEEHEHHHDHDHGHVHSHGGKAHSHLPPGTDGSAVTWRRLLFFGISAGLLPCPSALVVMLSAIALNRTAFGMVLIVFFSLGLAATLTGMGLLFVYARKLMTNFKLKPAGQVVRLVPVVSAFVIAVLGIAISYEALIQTGILNR